MTHERKDEEMNTTTMTSQKLFYVACIKKKDGTTFDDGCRVHYSPEFSSENEAAEWAKSYSDCWVRVIGN